MQYHLNGAPGQNIWILKPAGKSRGRGIRCLNDLEQIREYTTGEETQVRAAGKGVMRELVLSTHDAVPQWVAQKYIENPLLVYKRKFDIRQWVLVTSWNPLVVWMYRVRGCCRRRCGRRATRPDGPACAGAGLVHAVLRGGV